MSIFSREGVIETSETHHQREAVTRQEMVPAQVLSRLLRDAERELSLFEGLSWNVGGPMPLHIRQEMADTPRA